MIQSQRDLVSAKAAETSSLVSYSDARITLDQTLGTILDTHHVVIDEARTGMVK